MHAHKFTIIVSSYHPDRDDVTSILLQAGCGDFVVSFRRGLFVLEVEREAETFSSALISAFGDAVQAGAKVERFEPDYLVSRSDIAKRSRLSRGALTNYHKGDRGTRFPTPVARVTSGSPLWDWHEVATWLHGREHLGQDEVVRALILKEANHLLDTRGLEQDDLVGQLAERIGGLSLAECVAARADG